MADDYTEKTRLLVWTLSGGRCAFSGCGKPLVLDLGHGDLSLVGQMAHIVASSRQGPRGYDGLDDENRREAANFILLCPDHHKVVDDHPLRFPVPVLRRLKQEHEARFAPRDSVSVDRQDAVEETLSSSMLWVAGLPGRIFSARTSESSVAAVAAKIPRGELVPFVLHDSRLHAFHDLADPAGPLARAVTPGTTEEIAAEPAWDDPDLFRRYVALLNRTMTLHLAARGLAFDPKHHRHHFLAIDQRERDITYSTRAGALQRLGIVHRERTKAGDEKDVWWHQAVRLRFERVAAAAWYLTIRPEFHLTTDGAQPMPPKRVGRRITRRKSTMYNREYLNRVHFWRWFLCGEGEPRLVLEAGQTIVIDARLVEAHVVWPGVPDDDAEPLSGSFEETLFTQQRLLDAVGNVANWEELIA
jgi:hypothetical protein